MNLRYHSVYVVPSNKEIDNSVYSNELEVWMFHYADNTENTKQKILAIWEGLFY